MANKLSVTIIGRQRRVVQQPRPRYDQLAPRRWCHLDFGRCAVYLESKLWRVECTACGVVVEQVTWAEPGARRTRPFDEFVVWLAQRRSRSA